MECERHGTQNILIYAIGCLLLIRFGSSMASSRHLLDVSEVVPHVGEVCVHTLDFLFE